MMPRPVRKPDIVALPENKAGKDFVIGDVHAMVHLLQALVATKLDKSENRLFLVGDLIDRGKGGYGQGSEQVLDLIIKFNAQCKAKNLPPQIYPCLGNHEKMALSYINLKLKVDSGEGLSFEEADYFERSVETLMQNGADWLLDTPTKKLILYKEFFDDLPYIIHVPGDHPFNTVHADIPFDESVIKRLKTNPYLSEAEKEHALWARQQNDKLVIKPRQEKYELTLCGHNILGGVRADHINLDFGSFYTEIMCLAEPKGGKAELYSTLSEVQYRAMIKDNPKIKHVYEQSNIKLRKIHEFQNISNNQRHAIYHLLERLDSQNHLSKNRMAYYQQEVQSGDHSELKELLRELKTMEFNYGLLEIKQSEFKATAKAYFEETNTDAVDVTLQVKDMLRKHIVPAEVESDQLVQIIQDMNVSISTMKAITTDLRDKKEEKEAALLKQFNQHYSLSQIYLIQLKNQGPEEKANAFSAILMRLADTYPKTEATVTELQNANLTYSPPLEKLVMAVLAIPEEYKSKKGFALGEEKLQVIKTMLQLAQEYKQHLDKKSVINRLNCYKQLTNSTLSALQATKDLHRTGYMPVMFKRNSKLGDAIQNVVDNCQLISTTKQVSEKKADNKKDFIKR